MFYQNPFGADFRQGYPIDQQAIFSIPANLNNIAEMISGNTEPYNFSVVNTFTINIAYDPLFIGYTAISVNVAGAIPAATTANEVATLLNSNALFADNFTATLVNANRGGLTPPFRVLIRATKPRQSISCYVTNAGAEQILRFNYQAPVKELPTYFSRYTVDNRFVFPDGPHMLIALDPSNPVDAAVITAASLNPAIVQPDWQLLNGRSNTHPFSQIMIDGSGRITQIIEYFAGSVVGDLSRKIQYVYVGANTTPSAITTIPYTLTSSDLVTPP